MLVVSEVFSVGTPTVINTWRMCDKLHLITVKRRRTLSITANGRCPQSGVDA